MKWCQDWIDVTGNFPKKISLNLASPPDEAKACDTHKKIEEEDYFLWFQTRMMIKNRSSIIMNALGVTLLEIMLVLALASLVLVLSIRYYQSTQNALGIQQMQRAVAAIIAFSDSYGLSAGTYTGLKPEGVWSSLPKDMQGASPDIKTQWGDAKLSITPGAAPGDNYEGKITMPDAAPDALCQQTAGFIKNITSEHGGKDAGCTGKVVSWKYTLNPS